MQPIIFSHFGGSSAKAVLHYVQEIHSGKFRKYDYGYVKNLLIYNSVEPPDYDLSKTTVPIALFYANNDQLIVANVSNGKVDTYLNNENILYNKELLDCIRIKFKFT